MMFKIKEEIKKKKLKFLFNLFVMDIILLLIKELKLLDVHLIILFIK